MVKYLVKHCKAVVPVAGLPGRSTGTGQPVYPANPAG
jgi:hypothetical protein